LISVIIANYNRERTIGRAIDSVLMQDSDDWELIVVDDGSTDGSVEVIERYDDPRIRLARHKVNRGVTAAKNTGFDRIRGEWFTTLDSDDEMAPDALSVMMAAAERTGATAVDCNAVDSVTGGLTGTGVDVDGWLDPALVGGVHWGITRTDLLGGMRFDERIPWGEETLWLKIGRRALRYYVAPSLLVVHTEGSDRLTVAKRSLIDTLRDYRALGDDREYLAILRETSPNHYRDRMKRIRVSRLVGWALGQGSQGRAQREGLLARVGLGLSKEPHHSVAVEFQARVPIPVQDADLVEVVADIPGAASAGQADEAGAST